MKRIFEYTVRAFMNEFWRRINPKFKSLKIEKPGNVVDKCYMFKRNSITIRFCSLKNTLELRTYLRFDVRYLDKRKQKQQRSYQFRLDEEINRIFDKDIELIQKAAKKFVYTIHRDCGLRCLTR